MAARGMELNTWRRIDGGTVNIIEILNTKGMDDRYWDFQPFSEWTSLLFVELGRQKHPVHPCYANPYYLQSIQIMNVKVLDGDKVTSMEVVVKLGNCNRDTGAKQELTQTVVFREHSAALLIMLIPEKEAVIKEENAEIVLDANPADDEPYVILTVQTRIAIPSFAFAELPCGTFDYDGKFEGKAADEIKKLLDKDMDRIDMDCLTKLGIQQGEQPNFRDPTVVFPSSSTFENVEIHAYQHKLPKKTLNGWIQRLAAFPATDQMRLKLVPMRDLWKVAGCDAKVHSALSLWEGLKREGKVKVLKP